MRSMKSRSLALATAALGLAAALGGSLGLVAAGTRQPLASGFNLVGGPLAGDVAPVDFVGCLPAGSWTAIYIWDGATQQWSHFFRTDGTTIPAYVNDAAARGIVTIPRNAGVVLMMAQAVANPRLRDTSSEQCTS